MKINISKEFTALSGTYDKLLMHNPDRGFRTELCLLIKEHYPDERYDHYLIAQDKERQSSDYADERGLPDADLVTQESSRSLAYAHEDKEHYRFSW